MKIAFFDNGLQYDGSTPFSKPLGGSESALVYLTRELAKLGHEIHVYNKCDTPGEYDGVIYHPNTEMGAANSFVHWDAVVSLRTPNIFGTFTQAYARVLWSQDVFDQPVLKDMRHNEDIRSGIDCVFCISRWHAWMFMEFFRWPTARLYATRNGIVPEFFSPKLEPLEGRGKRLVYSSTPFRGLELLLDLFPAIKLRVPEAELHVYSSMKVYQFSRAEDEKSFSKIYSKLKQPGIVSHGSVGQKDLAKAMQTYRIMAYPNMWHETGCIAAMEAQAAGCPVVTTKLAALAETVSEGGILIDEIPGTMAYNAQFVEECVRLLTDDELWLKKAQVGRDRMLNLYSWSEIAKEWVEKIDMLIEDKKRDIEQIEGTI